MSAPLPQFLPSESPTMAFSDPGRGYDTPSIQPPTPPPARRTYPLRCPFRSAAVPRGALRDRATSTRHSACHHSTGGKHVP